MGISLFNRCSGITPKSNMTDSSLSSLFAKAVDPDPNKFNVVSVAKTESFHILEVIYHGCTNYEGRKIIVMRSNLKRREILELKWLDPHFSENGVSFKINGNDRHYKIIARFEPSEEGRDLCQKFVNSLK